MHVDLRVELSSGSGIVISELGRLTDDARKIYMLNLPYIFDKYFISFKNFSVIQKYQQRKHSKAGVYVYVRT